MKTTDWDTVLAAYRQGAMADFVQMKVDGEWGILWSVTPCSAFALEQAACQANRCRAEGMKHVRHAVLRNQAGATRRAVVVTELPGWRQEVRCLETGRPVRVDRRLVDESLAGLKAAFSPNKRQTRRPR
jgi:hypothetical protein